MHSPSANHSCPRFGEALVECHCIAQAQFRAPNQLFPLAGSRALTNGSVQHRLHLSLRLVLRPCPRLLLAPLNAPAASAIVWTVCTATAITGVAPAPRVSVSKMARHRRCLESIAG